MNSRTAQPHRTHHSSLGNAAVDGLIAGIPAGIAMLGYLLLTSGDAPADLFNRFTGAGVPPSPLIGAVGHLAVSAIYGMIFSMGWAMVKAKNRRLIRVIAAVSYGLILFAAAEWVILPAVQSPLLDIPALHWGIAHVIYGIVLGLITKSQR